MESPKEANQLLYPFSDVSGLTVCIRFKSKTFHRVSLCNNPPGEAYFTLYREFHIASQTTLNLPLIDASPYHFQCTWQHGLGLVIHQLVTWCKNVNISPMIDLLPSLP